MGTPEATLPVAWRYRIRAGTGWSGVSIYSGRLRGADTRGGAICRLLLQNMFCECVCCCYCWYCCCFCCSLLPVVVPLLYFVVVVVVVVTVVVVVVVVVVDAR